MAGEDQYVNPIINAMIQTAQLSRQRERDVESAKQHTENLKLQQAKFDADNKQQQFLNDQATQEHERTENHRKATLQNLTDKLHLEMNQQGMDKLLNVQKAIASGVKPEAFQNPGVDASPIDMPGLAPNVGKTPEGMVDIGNGKTAPVSAFPGPAEEAQNIQSRAQAVAQGQANVRDPLKEAADERRLQRETEIHTLDRSSAERIAAANRDASIINHRATLAAHEKGGLDGIDPDYTSNKINDIYFTGNSTESSIPAKLKQAFGSNVPTGFTPIDPKDKPVLNDVSKIQDILKIGRQLAQYNLTESPLEVGKGILGMGQISALKNQLTGLSGTIAETFGKEVGRKSEGDIQRAVNLLYSPRLSTEENLKNVEEANKIFKDVLKPILSKYPEEQRKGILAKRGIDPDLLSVGSSNTSKTIKIKSPKGTIKEVPIEDKDLYLQHGGTVVQ